MRENLDDTAGAATAAPAVRNGVTAPTLEGLLEDLSRRPVPVGRFHRARLFGASQLKVALRYLTGWLRSLQGDAGVKEQQQNEARLRAALELAGTGPRLIVVGGELRRLSQTLVGPLTRHMLQELRIDKAFMGTIGLTVKEGPTTTDPDEAYTKEQVMARAGQVILLADSGKVGTVSFTRAGRLEDIDVLITDNEVDRKFTKRLGKLGIDVVRV